MKKIYISLLAISLLFGGQAFAYDDGGLVHRTEESGGSTSDPVRVLQLVRNPMTSGTAAGDGTFSVAISAGDVVLWDLTSDDGVTVNIVGEGGITASNDAVAGVAAGTIPTADQAGTNVTDLGHRNWGYIQTYGLVTNCHVNSSAITAGDGLKASSVTRRAGTGAITSVNGPFTMTGNNGALGVALDTSSANGNAEVFVRTR